MPISGQELRALREGLGATQEELAQEMGVPRPRVSEIENKLRVRDARAAQYEAAIARLTERRYETSKQSSPPGRAVNEN